MLTQTLAVISVLLTLGLAAVSAFVVLIRGGQHGLERNNQILDHRVEILERELEATRAERDAALAGKLAAEESLEALHRIKTNDEKVDKLAARLDQAIGDLARHNDAARKHWRHEDQVGDRMVSLLTDALSKREGQ